MVLESVFDAVLCCLKLGPSTRVRSAQQRRTLKDRVALFDDERGVDVSEMWPGERRIASDVYKQELSSSLCKSAWRRTTSTQRGSGVVCSKLNFSNRAPFQHCSTTCQCGSRRRVAISTLDRRHEIPWYHWRSGTAQRQVLHATEGTAVACNT